MRWNKMHRLPDCLRVSIPITNPHRCNHRHSLGSPHSTLRPLQRQGTLQPVYAKSKDGKQKRLKSEVNAKSEEKLAGQNGNRAAPTPSPPRVEINSLMGVRTQIRILREGKKTEASSYRKPPVPQTYRKETKAPEEYRQERAAAEAISVELSKNESKNFALSKLYKTAESATNTKLGVSTTSVAVLPPPVLLVDGYNVLYKWERTSALMKNNAYSSDGNGGGGGLEIDIARDILIEALGVYSQTNGVRVIVAFDAMHGSATGIEEQILSTGVTVAYTGNCEADSFIEAQVDFWLQKRHPYVVVATSDVAQKAVVDSKTGPDKRQIVFVVPASGLCKDIEATEKRLEQQLMDLAMQPVARGILGSAVKFKDKTAFSKMQKMREVLPTASTLPELEKLKRRRSGGDGRGQQKPRAENESSI
ncbi:hypothetical protein Ndes2526A_g04147 [Nannochloris sp. 'desiccata']